MSMVSGNLVQIRVSLWPIPDYTHHRPSLSAHPSVLLTRKPRCLPYLHTFVHADLSPEMLTPPNLGTPEAPT